MIKQILCPNCGREMKQGKRKIFKTICTVFCQTDADEAEFETIEGYNYKCEDCKIKYNSIENEWKIPKNIESDISYKQQHCIEIICANLGFEIPYIINKNVASKFITEYLDKSKQRYIRTHEDEMLEDFEYFDPNFN